MRFDLTDLNLFIQVADSGSITAGAERCHLSLASASARIRGMEKTLGTPLLQRGRRGVTPTPAGRALLHHAQTIAAQVQHLRGDLGQYAQGLKGHIRLLGNTAALSEFLPEALTAFLAAHPQVDVDVEERLSHHIVEAIAAGLGDVGIIADSVDPGELETLPFREDRLVLVCSRRHGLAGRETVNFADTLDWEWVGLTPGSALPDFLAAHGARIGRQPRYRVRLGNFDALCRMVEAGVGVGIVPVTAARRYARSMDLAVVPLADAWASRQLRLCCRRLEALPPYARQLVEHLRQAAPPAI